MSNKILLALFLTILCIPLSAVGENIFVAYSQILCYIIITALITSRYYEEK